MDELIKAMKIAFATEYGFAIKAQFCHWNVIGPEFPQYHALFDTIYTEVYGAIDPFGENIRKLGSYTPASYTRFSMLSEIDEFIEVPPAMALVAGLLEDSEKCTRLFKMVYDLAEREGKHGLSNFLAERMDAHDKHSWMLRSTLK